VGEEQRPLVRMPGEGRVLPVGASSVRLLSVGGDTGDRSSTEEIAVPARFGGPPPHYHNRTNHSWFVVEGELLLTVGEDSLAVAPGGFVYIPTGVGHTFANPGEVDARMVQFTTPGGFDVYMEEISAAFPAGTDIDPGVMIEIMARHDTFPV